MPALMKRTITQSEAPVTTGSWDLDEALFGSPTALPSASSPAAKKLKMFATSVEQPASKTGLSVGSIQQLHLGGTGNCQDSLAAMVSLVSTPPSMRKQLGNYLDLGGPESDAVVPSAKDLVTAETAWLPDSMPGSPVPSYGSPDEDAADEAAAADDEMSPSAIGSLFGAPGAAEGSDLSAAFDAALLDADDGEGYRSFDSVRFGSDDILFTIDTASPRAPPPSRETTPEPMMMVPARPLQLPAAKPTGGGGKPKKSHKSKAAQAAGALKAANKAAKAPKKSKAAVDAAKAAAAIAKAAAKAAAAQIKAAAAPAEALDYNSEGESHPDETDKAKTIRFVHNSTERKRRCEIRRLFGDLRDLFPNLEGDDRTSNITTLTSAITHIAELVSEGAQQSRDLVKLRKRNAALRAARGMPTTAAAAAAPAIQAPAAADVTAPEAAPPQPIIPQSVSTAAPTPEHELPAAAMDMAVDMAVNMEVSMEAEPAVVTTGFDESTPLPVLPVFSSPVEALAAGAVAAVVPNSELRKTLPPALRELLDHNGRGTSEILQPRRRRPAGSA